MHYMMALPCVALHCNALYGIALHCNVPSSRHLLYRTVPVLPCPFNSPPKPGMHTNAVDARRAMALVEQPDVADGSDSASSYASPRAGATGRQGADGSSTPAWEASKGAGGGGIGGGRPDDAAALVRRAKALGVPPLPPDLGAVRCAKQTERCVGIASVRRPPSLRRLGMGSGLVGSTGWS